VNDTSKGLPKIEVAIHAHTARARDGRHQMTSIIDLLGNPRRDRGIRSIDVTQSIPSHCHPDAHRADGKRFVVRADEMLTAFVELQRAIHEFAVSLISLA
jgi:hypothetical protein